MMCVLLDGGPPFPRRGYNNTYVANAKHFNFWLDIRLTDQDGDHSDRSTRLMRQGFGRPTAGTARGATRVPPLAARVS